MHMGVDVPPPMFSTQQHPDAASPSGSPANNGNASQSMSFKHDCMDNGLATPAPEQTPHLIKAIGGVAATEVRYSVSRDAIHRTPNKMPTPLLYLMNNTI